MRIRIGILGNGDGWETLLRQEGIPHAPFSQEESPGDFSAIVASGALDRSSLERLRSFLAGGGGVLCSGRVFGQLSECATEKMFIRYVSGDGEGKFFGPGLVDILSVCEVPPNPNALSSDRGAFTAWVGGSGGGHMVVLPFDASELVLDRRAGTKSFYAAGRRLPFERVSLVSKGGVQRIVSSGLKILHHLRGVPYVHQWYYPAGQHSVFSLRIDTDYADRSEIEKLHDLGRRLEVPLTWFVHVGAQKDFLGLFRQMSGDEVGIHCFQHRAYRDADSLAEDVKSALHEFEAAGLDGRSFASPFGRWEEPIARRLDQFGFVYSSEFAYDYDGLPSFPHLDGGFSSTLQIPIHPVSVGSLRRVGFGEDEIVAYFRRLIERKVTSREPILLYHHPKNDCMIAIEEIFRLVKESGVRPGRMREYASWWKGRSTDGWRIEAGGESMTIQSPTGAAEPLLHIVRRDGLEALTAPLPLIDLARLAWKPAPVPLPVPRDIGRIRNFNPWIPIVRAEDWVMGILRR
ncbi:MAG TPA: hypothetical protein VES59_02215 [Bacteroidota bacterium]|nr:hypothetical protein [Bacteroidota bacterium]